MATVLDLITQALKDAGVIGVGQTASAEDSNDAFIKVNQMLAQWARQRWLVYHLVTSSFVSTGAQSYTIGPGGNFNVSPRPNNIDSAFVRQITGAPAGQQVDYGLTPILAREDYNKITLKSLVTWPMFYFYDTDWPTGNVYIWPIPTSGQFTIFLTYKQVLSAFTTLNQTVLLPPEYDMAIQLNLADWLRDAYQLPDNPKLHARAVTSLGVIRTANAQIPLMELPRGVSNPWGGIYNPYSDQVQ